MFFRILIISCLSFALFACATQQQQSTHDENNLADIKLAEAAADATHSLRALAEVEHAVNPGAKIKPPPDPASYDMAQIASIDWAGPIEPLVKRIADASGYQVHTLGRQPAAPILVTVNEKETPLGDILRDVQFQADKRANIVVYPSSKIIELRYAVN